MQNKNTVTTMLDRAIDELSPEVAFALGRASRYVDAADPEATLLIQEELASCTGQYTSTNSIGDAVEQRLRTRVKALVPAPRIVADAAETDAESVPPSEPAPPQMLPCAECGKPDVYLPGADVVSCSDCRAVKGVNVKPPGVASDEDVGF